MSNEIKKLKFIKTIRMSGKTSAVTVLPRDWLNDMGVEIGSDISVTYNQKKKAITIEAFK